MFELHRIFSTLMFSNSIHTATSSTTLVFDYCIEGAFSEHMERIRGQCGPMHSFLALPFTTKRLECEFVRHVQMHLYKLDLEETAYM